VADGKVHLIGNLVLGAALTGTTLALAPTYAPYVFVGSVIGTIITPDLDIDHKTETEHILNQIPGIGWLFGQAWYGYATLFRHRGLSHNLFLGTPGRILWSLLIIVVSMIFLYGIFSLAGLDYNPLAAIKYTVSLLLNPVLIASWWSMDIMHYILDI
jgi:uncharacterized metal-binding protein